jgi:hypothetical protein
VSTSIVPAIQIEMLRNGENSRDRNGKTDRIKPCQSIKINQVEREERREKESERTAGEQTNRTESREKETAGKIYKSGTATDSKRIRDGRKKQNKQKKNGDTQNATK